MIDATPTTTPTTRFKIWLSIEQWDEQPDGSYEPLDGDRDLPTPTRFFDTRLQATTKLSRMMELANEVPEVPSTTLPAMVSPKIIDALRLTSNNDTRGNVAAHAYNLGQGGGMMGVNLGWLGMDASTDFVMGIVDSVDELLDELKCTECEGGYIDASPYPLSCETCNETGLLVNEGEIDERLTELADSVVPIYNATRMKVLHEIDPMGTLETDPHGLMSDAGSSSYNEVAGMTLYAMANEIANALMSAVDELDDDDEPEDDVDDDVACTCGAVQESRTTHLERCAVTKT